MKIPIAMNKWFKKIWKSVFSNGDKDPISIDMPSVYDDDLLPHLDLYGREIYEHFKRLFPDIESCYVWHECISYPFHLDVYIVYPSKERPYYVLFTTGMSCVPMDVDEETQEEREKLERAELMMYLPENFPLKDTVTQESKTTWPLRFLQTLARYPYENKTWFGRFQTFGPYPGPIAPDTKQCGGIFMSLRDKLGKLVTSDGTIINLYLVIPLYIEEIKYKLTHEVEDWYPLMKKLPPVVNLKRSSLCPKVTEKTTIEEIETYDGKGPIMDYTRTCNWMALQMKVSDHLKLPFRN
jgi:hypothetical protein